MTSPRRRVVEAPSRKKPSPELRGIRVVFAPDPFAEGAQPSPYRRGECRHVFAIAEAEVVIEEILQVLTSSGLYGIETASEDEFLEEVVAQEWTALRKVLTAVGVPTGELPLDVDRAWIEWRM
jgi:hypothetical protein